MTDLETLQRIVNRYKASLLGQRFYYKKAILWAKYIENKTMMYHWRAKLGWNTRRLKALR